MRGKVRGCALAVMALSASGCASANFFNTTTSWDDAPPTVARVFVVARMKSNELDATLYGAFESTLRKEFTRCGIKSEVMHTDDNTVENLNTASARFQPDSVLVIKDTGGGTVTVNLSNFSQRNELDFELTLLNAAKNTSYWHTYSKFDFRTKALYADNIISGQRLARAIVTRLRDDKVIKQCQMTEEDAKAERDEAAKRAKENSGFNVND
ncbi:hypothetical protein [Pyxidicoccus caerfyrddinensis]|uniref:hypothetical protein n=1 Tax=Pyxidicoccus caerfyrddinensis TaxID=2709663 RepID=UPI0013D9885E|nr:hypothetical protein [Pyxidicoccus caerfyrddinensis]